MSTVEPPRTDPYVAVEPVGFHSIVFYSLILLGFIAFLGIQKAGAAVVPVAPIYTSHETIYMINDAAVETVICMDDTNFCYVKEAFAGTGLKRVIVTNLADLLPLGKRVLGHLFDKIPTGELIYQERSADIIKHKAFRVSASEVEAALQDHPTVIGACVVGVPDPKVGERIKAIVVLKEDARGVGGTELIQCAANAWRPTRSPPTSSSGTCCPNPRSESSCDAKSATTKSDASLKPNPRRRPRGK